MKYFYFAQAYGQGTYGACNYEQTTSCTTSGTSSSSSNGLVNTGLAIAVIVTLACLLIFVSLVVRIWRRNKRTPEVAPVEADDRDDFDNPQR